jgi:DNA polymerase-3 subunit epsilon
VRLTTDEAWPRLVVTNEPSATGLHIGPLTSKSAAMAVVEAVQSALPIRRCNARIGRTTRTAATPCRGAQLGVAMCPCSGDIDEAAYWRVVAQAVAALTTSPEIVLRPLWERVESLAIAQRYEEAALTRDRAQAFAAAIGRQRLIDQLRAAGDVGVRLHDTVYHLRDGVLLDAALDGQLATGLELPPPDTVPAPAPLPRHAADEVMCLARAIEKASYHARLLWCSGEWAWPATPVLEVTRLATAAA